MSILMCQTVQLRYLQRDYKGCVELGRKLVEREPSLDGRGHEGVRRLLRHAVASIADAFEAVGDLECAMSMDEFLLETHKTVGPRPGAVARFMEMLGGENSGAG